MRPFIRHALRQQRMAYALVCFFLFVLAMAVVKIYGRTAIILVWAGFVFLLEFGYRRLLSFEARNRRSWWAKPRSRTMGLRFYVYCGCIVLYIFINSPFTRYASIALLAAGVICAGIIHLLHRAEEL